MNIEKEKRKIHTGSIMLMIISITMIVISIRSGILAPGLTGAGFLILVWMQEENKSLEHALRLKNNKSSHIKKQN